MQRSKHIGLLHTQMTKDSAISKQGGADYLVTMRKRGDNEYPIVGIFDHYVGEDRPVKNSMSADDYVFKLKPIASLHDSPYYITKAQATNQEIADSISIWQRYASPVWMDINQSNTLQHLSARENDDERHICPLQLDVIHRALQLWTNPNDLVLDPFNGIGSSGYEALKMNRRYVGFELKKSYFNMAVKNLKAVEMAPQQMDLLSMVA
jgi:hypothetical protein